MARDIVETPLTDMLYLAQVTSDFSRINSALLKVIGELEARIIILESIHSDKLKFDV